MQSKGVFVNSGASETDSGGTELPKVTAEDLENYAQRFLGTSVYCLPHHIQLELVVVNATPSPDMPDI